MSIDTLIAKAKDYDFPQEKVDLQEQNRIEFITKFPLERIGRLELDDYVAGTGSRDSFSYWLEFKKIAFGIGGGTALKFGIYKSKEDGNYYAARGKNKILLQGVELETEFQKLKDGILLALEYVQLDKVQEIRNIDSPISKMVLQKILFIYNPNKFIPIGASNALIDLANDINLEIDLAPNNLIEINYECRKYLNSVPELRNWSYEKLGTLVWANYRKDLEPSEDHTVDSRKYWLYAPGLDAEMWDLFYSQGIIALGWDKLGDLSKYKSKDEIANKLKELENTTSSKRNDATANYDFDNVISVGDIVIVKKGRTELLGYGEVTSDYYFDNTRDRYKSCRRVDWKKKGVWDSGHSLALKTLTNITTFPSEDPKYEKYADMLLGIMKNGSSGKIDYKAQYIQWLDKSSLENSSKKSSYLKAIEILSEIQNENLFEQSDLNKLDFLYKDLLREQSVEGGKYFYRDAPSYGKSGFYSAAINSYVQFLREYLGKEPKSTSSKKMPQLNRILFGPPGTGKTYNTVNRALEILGVETQGKSRSEVKDIFDAKMKNGQIVFTTFHQSMSYEDFIEGIKPLEPKVDGQQVVYKVIDGIFKRACSIAAYNSYKIFTETKTQSAKYSFDDLYEAFTESIQKQLTNGKPPIYKTLRGKEVEVKEINSNDSIIARAKDSVAKSSAPLTKENLQKLYDRFKNVEEIEDLKDVRETVQVLPRITEFYAVFSGLKEFEKTFKPDEQVIIESKEAEPLNFEEIQKKFNAGVYNDAIKSFGNKADPVVMIIDEINRGNVSQIFGELITLIEEDKRQGKEEALEVTLPYSKDKFGVPPNLFIIGTMNTADRSVEALDAALRRRFSFEEMPPKYDLGQLQYEFASIEVHLILEAINKRIERLLDKDHAIGHSYFIPRNGENAADKILNTFYNNIIPLLQEYFYGDYGKIGMVLGKGFIQKKEWNNEMDSFAEFEYESSSDFDDKDVYRIIDYRKQNESNSIRIRKDKEERIVQLTFEKAIRLLMKQDIE